MEFSMTFLHMLWLGLSSITPILLLLGLSIIVLGLLVGRLESWRRFDALYWAFITALTVGYGDIRPTKKLARLLSTLIALIGIMFTGIVVAVTVEATSVAFNKHVKPEVMQQIYGESN